MNYECLRIQKTLKSLMKAKKWTYTDLAKQLNSSAATIKRRLNGDDLSLNEIKELATALNISFYELLEISKQIKKEPYMFSVEQEKLLSSNINLILIFRFIISGLSFDEIKKNLKLSDSELRKFSKQLESVHLIELHTGDRFQSLVEFPFRWRTNGDLHKTYDHILTKNILNRIDRSTSQPGLNHIFEIMLTQQDYTNFCKDITDVYRKYSNQAELQIESKPNIENIVSGIFYIDRFSIWD